LFISLFATHLLSCRPHSLGGRNEGELEGTARSFLTASRELLARLLETQEEQDRWLAENKVAIQAKIRHGIDQLDRGEGIPEQQLDAHLASLKSMQE
jgi:hypothetical protein